MSFPTRRELVLVVGLLLTLLLLSQFHVFSPAKQHQLFEDDEEFSTDVAVVEKQPVSGFPEPRLRWTDTPPETKHVAYSPGWSLFDNLYLMNGTLFWVTSAPSDVPDLKLVISAGIALFNGDEEQRKRLPTDKNIRVVTPQEAAELFGTKAATRIDGPNYLINDAHQFVTHYFHFTAELFMGLWRCYSSQDPFISPEGETTLPPPKRLFFPHVETTKWRDYASMNQWVLRGAFPQMSMEFQADWEDRAKMHMPFVFDRVVLSDRSAATKGPNYANTWRITAEAFSLPGSKHWWAPVRNNVLEFSGLAAEWINGPDPALYDDRKRMVITYISRQEWNRRKLIQEDHLKLVKELENLRDTYGYELNIVSMEKISRAEQVMLAGRTTIMMGVHGNGLTSLVWMRPMSASTVIEFFYPKGIAFDYEFTTRCLGMRHYGVWDSKTFTRPDIPRNPNFPEGFQGNSIPLNGKVVAELVQRRLSGEE